jgi:hypothetical protein
MTHKKDEALKLALEALETAYAQTCSVGRAKDWQQLREAITAIKQALAAQPVPVQEPITWLKTIETLGGFGKFVEAKPNEKGAKPVYLTPPAQPAPVPLTPEQRRNLWVSATIELPSQENCYYRGIADSEAYHGITAAPEKGQP